jgi:phosphoribosylglycinamide formyltransferase-1
VTINLAVFISGRGSNLLAIIKAIEAKQLDAKINVVISSNTWAPAHVHCSHYGIPVSVCRSEEQILSVLKQFPIDLICLAGYMKILSPDFVKRFRNKILNIHPSLLPKYPGLKTHEQALAAGDSESGCTVHYVTEKMDEGKVIEQRKVPVEPGDTPETLAARVLVEEHKLYPEVIGQFARQLSKVS